MFPYANRALRRPRWGNLRRDQPFLRRFGADRGTPIDQYYTGRFIDEHRWRITGDILEVGEDRDASRFGHQVRRVEIVDIAHYNLLATLLADLAEVGSLAATSYDCAIVTHTLQHIPDAAAALANVWQSLRPGGSLLLTVPCLGRREPNEEHREAWRFLEPGLQLLVTQACTPPPTEIVIASHGNLRIAIAILMGLAAEELEPSELDADDSDYPVMLTLAATKPREGHTAVR